MIPYIFTEKKYGTGTRISACYEITKNNTGSTGIFEVEKSICIAMQILKSFRHMVYCIPVPVPVSYGKYRYNIR
jgi:hypothetical protein